MQTSMQTDDLLHLQEPVATAGAIRAVNGFNGRLLTGADLTRLQEARRTGDRHLGLALGDGVAFGLDVVQHPALSSAAAPVLRVAPGLAVNRLGQGLRLERETAVALTRRFETPVPATLFEPCNPIAAGTYVAGAGVYVLTVAPASLPEGRAPSNGLDPAAVRCNIDATVEALQFRLLAVPAALYADLDPASRRFRSQLAYRCFGIDERERALADPWRDDPLSYGLIDALRDVGLEPRDVPLALIYWTANGLRFIDNWAVRRRLHAADGPEAGAFLQRERLWIEGEAICAQFQAHLADLLATTAQPEKLVAADHMDYLPPFGMLPLRRAPVPGFHEDSFLSGVIRRPGPGSGQPTELIDGRLIPTLRRAALAHAPCALASREHLWVFRSWQNRHAEDLGQPVQPILYFASGRIPHPAPARFDQARVDYGTFVACCGD